MSFICSCGHSSSCSSEDQPGGLAVLDRVSRGWDAQDLLRLLKGTSEERGEKKSENQPFVELNSCPEAVLLKMGSMEH